MEFDCVLKQKQKQKHNRSLIFHNYQFSDSEHLDINNYPVRAIEAKPFRVADGDVL